MDMARDQRLELRLSGAEFEAVRGAANAQSTTMADVVRSGLRFTTRKRPVYSFDGHGASFVRDSWMVRHPMDTVSGDDGVYEAKQRLKAFAEWRAEAADHVHAFAAISTTNASEIITPEYKPILASFVEDRPLFAATTRASVGNASPFLLPGTVDEASVNGAVAEHTEGSNPSENAAIAFGQVTVAPKSISGLYRVTRELVDSSNPAIDTVCLSVMRESYARQTEARIYAALNTAQSGTITSGFVPSGAMARTSTGPALPSDLRKALLGYVDGRGRAPRSVVASSRPSVAEELDELDMTAYALRNVNVDLSPRITGTAAADGDVFILGGGDVWAWSSPLLEFQYGEREGPASVDLALFGYFAAAVVAPRGVSSIRHT